VTAERLSPQHAEELNSSRISADLIQQRGYRTVTADDREKLREAGCPAWALQSDDAFPGLFLPLHSPFNGEYVGFQFKPAVPQFKPGDDKPLKYASPRGMGNRLDVHPACVDRIKDTSQALWITEGIKKGDALASRGQAVVALTGVWNWRRTEGALAEWEDVPVRGRAIAVCFDSDAPTNPSVRHAMARLVAWLRQRGAAKVYYLPVPPQVNGTDVKGVDDYLAAGGTVDGLYAHASERAPVAPVSAQDAAFTDAFLTDTVCAEALDGSFLYSPGLGWMRYDGIRWTEANESLIVEEIRLWAKGHWEEVLEEHKQDSSHDVKARVNGWRQILSSGRLKALASLARGPLHAEATAFDAHPDLLNTPTGVVDLRTGELLDPDPGYLMTKVTGVPYQPERGMDPDFQQALRALPDELHSWYQLRIGQAFTGHMTSDDVMLIQQGSGENGKSTLAVPIKRAAGGYYVLVSDRVILGNPDQHPTETMDLKGARYALMEETPEARQLNVQQLKKTVGSPDITARRIRQDTVRFDATHSLFVNTNFAPSVVEVDHASWRRLALLRFPYTFRKSPDDVTGPYDRLGDQALRERCMTQPGPATSALAWAVTGAVRWYAAGKVFPPMPDLVVADTLAWRREGDLIMSFAEQFLEFGPGIEAKSQELFQAFSEWIVTQGHKAWSQKTFKSRFGGHDMIASRHVGERRDRVRGVLWEGVRIVPQAAVRTSMTGSNPF